MSFFKKIFGQTKEIKSLNQTIASKVKTSILDFFQMDIRKIPDETFIEGNPTTEKAQNFRKFLNYKECSLFDTVEIIKFNDHNQNVTFSSVNWNKDYLSVQKLVDDLFLIYGADDVNSGRFSSFDKNCLLDNSWTGRLWIEHKKHKYPIMLNLINETFSLTILNSPK